MSARYRIVHTCAGYVGIVVTDRGVRRVFLPRRSAAAMKRDIRSSFPDAIEDADLMPKLARDLDRYFEGKPVQFDVPLDWSGCPDFEVDVWRACRAIPYGETGSYKLLAERVGRPGGARAVGMAMSHNPFPLIVPCHRVVKSDGSLGGYSGPGGVAFKQRLLELEGAAR